VATFLRPSDQQSPINATMIGKVNKNNKSALNHIKFDRSDLP
jgi:hypothetical protein